MEHNFAIYSNRFLLPCKHFKVGVKSKQGVLCIYVYTSFTCGKFYTIVMVHVPGVRRDWNEGKLITTLLTGYQATNRDTKKLIFTT